MRTSIFLFVLATIACACQPAESRKTLSRAALTAHHEAEVAPTLEVDLSYLSGKFDPAQHPDFVKVEASYADRTGMYLRKEAYEGFKKMHAAAAAEGVKLSIISATRNFAAQKGIWEAKWNGSRSLSSGENAATAYPDPVQRALKILEWSSMPGSSRHHWGTDIDLNSLNNDWFLQGEGKKIYAWLQVHAAEYGFCQTYSEKGEKRPQGYNEEKWHWSYLPLSRGFTEQAKTLMKDELFSGFAGAETAVKIGVVKHYVLGINPDCR
jgi:zinc D-Ala-D-Ala carboxypeptidase